MRIRLMLPGSDSVAVRVSFMDMTVNLTPHAEELLQQLLHAGSPEQVVEEALERLFAEQGSKKNDLTAHQAVDRIRELRKGITLGGISVEDLVNEGRKH